MHMHLFHHTGVDEWFSCLMTLVHRLCSPRMQEEVGGVSCVVGLRAWRVNMGVGDLE